MGIPNLRSLAVSESKTLSKSIGHFASDIKIAHSIFALPFAASTFLFGSVQVPPVNKIILLIICMVSARTAAMGMNRFFDRHIDLSNPRTRSRKIPSGHLSPIQGFFWSSIASLIFVFAAALLSPLAGFCAVPLLGVLISYSLMKRLTWLTHWYLGICLGLAPLAVEVALRGKLSAPVCLVGLAVAFWAAGFDILYSLQDMDFDKKIGLYSVPSKWGPSTSILISKCSFVLMISCLILAGNLAGRGIVYNVGIGVIGFMLLLEHWLVREAKKDGRSANLNLAFFNVNAWVSVLFFVAALLDEWVA